MKNLIALLLSCACVAAGIVVIHDPNSGGVPGQVTRVIHSVDPSRFVNSETVIVIPEPSQVSFSSLLTNDASKLRVVGGEVQLLSEAELTTITEFNTAAAIAEAAAMKQLEESVAKTNAIKSIEGELDQHGRIFRAFAEIMVNEINILRSQLDLNRVNETAFRSATNRSAVPLGARTLNQLQTAIRNKIDEQP